MKDITTLRSVALTSNFAFLIYGLGLGLAPVWLLHAVLLPINGWRLWQAVLHDRLMQREPSQHAASQPTDILVVPVARN
jgi:hypothetical protein